MSQDRVECSRCRETFATQDELMVHSIDAHTGEPAPGSAGDGSAEGGQGTTTGVDPGDLDEQTITQLRRVLETHSTGSGSLQALYGQRFIAGVAGTILVLAVALTGLHAIGVVQTAVFTFALGTLFGLTVAYLHAFVQAALR